MEKKNKILIIPFNFIREILLQMNRHKKSKIEIGFQFYLENPLKINRAQKKITENRNRLLPCEQYLSNLLGKQKYP